MKKLAFIIGMSAFILIFGMVVFGCDSSQNNGPDVPEIEEPDDPDEPDYTYDMDEPDVSILPNLLKMNDGTTVAKAADWPDRRDEIMKIMQEGKSTAIRAGQRVRKHQPPDKYCRLG